MRGGGFGGLTTSHVCRRDARSERAGRSVMRCLPTEIQATPYTRKRASSARQDLRTRHAAPHRGTAHADAPVRPRRSTVDARRADERPGARAEAGGPGSRCSYRARPRDTGLWRVSYRQVYLSVPRKCTASAHFHALLGLALRRGTGRCLGRSLGRCMLFWLPAQVVELVLVPLPKVLRLALLRRKFRRERQPSHQHVHLV